MSNGKGDTRRPRAITSDEEAQRWDATFAYERRTPDGRPEVDQGRVNGWWLSWNPDDGRYYVSRENDGVASATFKRWTNATYWARNNSTGQKRDT